MVVNVAINKNNGRLSGKPDILTRGFMLTDELDEILDKLHSRLQQTVDTSNGNVENEILRAVKSYIYQETKRNPFIFVTVNKV